MPCIGNTSAADCASLGCSSESDYTYFGRAFFDQAMHEQQSIKDALELGVKTNSSTQMPTPTPAPTHAATQLVGH